MDAADGVDPDLPYSLGNDSLPFNELELLDLRKLDIDNVERVSIYLSQVLPEGCELVFSDEMGEPFDSKWEEVVKWLPSLKTMNSEQKKLVKQQKRAFKEEVEIMKAKLASLGEY